MVVPLSLSKGRHDPKSPYYEDQEPAEEPDPDWEYEREVEKRREEAE